MSLREVALLFTGLLLVAGPGAATTDGRPRLYFDAAGLQRLQALAKQTTPTVYGFVPAAGWQAVLARAKALADAPPYHYRVHIPTANNEGPGWDWDYTLSAAPPPRHPESPHYPPWTALFQEREDTITTRLKHFALAWALTGEDRYFQKAREIVLDLVQWPQWTDPDYSSGSLSACLDTGHCTQTVGLFYDWCHAKLTEAERQTIRQALVTKGIQAIRKQLGTGLDPTHNFYAIINTGLGVAALALHGDEPQADGWIAEAVANTRRYYDQQGKDGGSFEGPMYGTYASDALAQLVFALDSSGTAHDLHQHPFLTTLPHYLINGLSPDVTGQATFGDGGWGAGYPDTAAMLAVHGDEAARYYLVETGDLPGGLATIDRFLFLGPLTTATALPAAPPWLGSDVFTDVGYAFLRGRDPGEPFLAFKSGPPVKDVGHNHYDSNSFQLTGFGQPLGWDPGYRSYFDPPKRRYTSSTLGHNSVVLDLDDAYLASTDVTVAGHDQVALHGAKLVEFLPGPRLAFVTGEAAPTYNPAGKTVLESFRRQIVYLPPNAYLVLDRLQAPAPHRYSWLLHGPAGATIATDGPRVTIAAGPAQLDGQVFSPGGVSWRSGLYPQAEAYGPYAAATTAQPATSARFVAALVPRASAEMVVNGGFEHGLNGWQIRDAEGQGPNHSASTAQAHSGTASGRIAGAGYLYSSRFALPAGRTFKVHAWVRTEGATKGASLTAYYWNAAGSSFAHQEVAGLKSEGQWREVVLPGTVPAGTARICVAFNFFDTGVAYVDDVSIETQPAPVGSTPATITALGADAAQGLVIAVDGWRHHVAFGRGGSVDSDGSLAVVSVGPDGQVARAMLQAGTRLTFEGKPLITTQQPATVSIERAGTGWTSVVRTDLTPHAPAADAAVGCKVGG